VVAGDDLLLRARHRLLLVCSSGDDLERLGLGQERRARAARECRKSGYRGSENEVAPMANPGVNALVSAA